MLLHHCWGEVNGKRGVWGHAIGGMGAITQAMARACVVRGVDIRTNSAVSKIVVEKGRAVGVVTDKGEKFAARALVSNLHPKLTFEKLLDPAVLPADFRARIASYRSGSGSFRMNLALAELPSFTALPGHAAGRASWRRNRDRAEPRLYGARLSSTPGSPAGRPPRSSKC